MVTIKRHKQEVPGGPSSLVDFATVDCVLNVTRCSLVEARQCLLKQHVICTRRPHCVTF